MIVFNSRPGIHIFESPRYVLYPGNNIIPDNIYCKLSENPFYIQRLENGSLKVINEIGSNNSTDKCIENGKENDAIEDILSMNVQKAKEVINEIYQIDILNKIKYIDKRMGIQKCIEDQIYKLTNTDQIK